MMENSVIKLFSSFRKLYRSSLIAKIVILTIVCIIVWGAYFLTTLKTQTVNAPKQTTVKTTSTTRKTTLRKTDSNSSSSKANVLTYDDITSKITSISSEYQKLLKTKIGLANLNDTYADVLDNNVVSDDAKNADYALTGDINIAVRLPKTSSHDVFKKHINRLENDWQKVNELLHKSAIGYVHLASIRSIQDSQRLVDTLNKYSDFPKVCYTYADLLKNPTPIDDNLTTSKQLQQTIGFYNHTIKLQNECYSSLTEEQNALIPYTSNY